MFPSLLREGVFPVAMKKRAAVVMATTPSEKPGSLFMELIRATDEQGRPRMYVVRSGQPCDDCMRTKEPWCVRTGDSPTHAAGSANTPSTKPRTGRTAPRRSACGTCTSARRPRTRANSWAR